MKSPFAIFRKHEKILMVILVLVAMIGFVLADVFTQASDIPPVVLVMTVMLIVGCVGWISGMPSNKSKEYGGWGLVLGAVLAGILVFKSRPSAAVQADFGTLSATELRELQQRREHANRFVVQAIRDTAPPNDPTTEQRLMLAQFRFGANAGSPRDVVLGEILRREAERVGLTANNESVTEYVQKMTSNRMTPEQFNKILAEMHLSEKQMYEILREQVQAKVAAQMLFEPAFAFPPEKYWEFYRQLYIKQSAEVAGVPVNEFVDDAETPPPAELNRIFQEYRENYPNQTKEGRLEEGRPGLYQPRRARLAFLEATFQEATTDIAAVTDDEIEAYYEENYKLPAEEAARRKSATGAGNSTTPANAASAPEVPGPSLPAQDTTPPASGNPSGTGKDEQPGASEGPSASSESNDSPESPAPAADGPSEDCAQEAEDEVGGDPSPSPAEGESAAGTADAPSGESPGTPEAPASSEGNSAPSPAQGAAGGGESTAGSTAAPTGGEPPLPQPTVPPLDDALKTRIREILTDQKVAEKLNKKLQTAADFVQDKIGRAFIFAEQDGEPMTAELAAEKANAYAAEQHLHYEETPYLSTAELVEQDEEYPIAMARTTTPGREDFIARAIFATGERDLYRPIIAYSETTKSWFACWKTGEEGAYAPENMNDERVREQAVTIWRQAEARKKAEARAQELAQQVRDSGKAMSEVLSEQRVTGSESSLFLEVVKTGDFHYQAFPNQLDPNPLILQYYGQPQILNPTGVEKAGPDFMDAVFNALAPGDVGVAANIDRSVYYVVKVVTRSQATPEEFQKFRQRFLQEPLFGYAYSGWPRRSVYQNLAIGELQENLLNWQDQLLRQHGVQLSALEQ